VRPSVHTHYCQKPNKCKKPFVHQSYYNKKESGRKYLQCIFDKGLVSRMNGHFYKSVIHRQIKDYKIDKIPEQVFHKEIHTSSQKAHEIAKYHQFSEIKIVIRYHFTLAIKKVGTGEDVEKLLVGV
jgi:hypothetical protein